ncbi:glycosyltransferase [Knoellia locipacati]|uniref:glycosyltransferase family 2 protein n=1 Tax=Knoellia locipacati TaxID=882824 RepID=UPI00384CA3B1
MRGEPESGTAAGQGNVRVSVVVPVYNVEEYLEQCVTSALDQTHEHLDIVLIDDGSTDGSGALCDDLAHRDPRVRVVHQENRGLSAARNAGLSLADGDLVTFLDSDDWWDPTFVATLVEALSGHPEAGTAVSGFVRMPGEASSMPTRTLRLYSVDESLGLFAGQHHTLLTISCAKLFRREVIHDVRFPEGRLHEDEFTTYRFLARAPAVLVPKHLYLYRQRPGGIASQTLTPDRLLDAVEAAEQQERDFRAWGHPAAAAWAGDQALRKRLRLIRLLASAGRTTEARQQETALTAAVRTDGELPHSLAVRALRQMARMSPRAAAVGFDLATRSRALIARAGSPGTART